MKKENKIISLFDLNSSKTTNLNRIKKIQEILLEKHKDLLNKKLVIQILIENESLRIEFYKSLQKIFDSCSFYSGWFTENRLKGIYKKSREKNICIFLFPNFRFKEGKITTIYTLPTVDKYSDLIFLLNEENEFIMIKGGK